MTEHRFVPCRPEAVASEEGVARGRALLAELDRRRSCRFFWDRTAPREVFELAIRWAGTAPSGAHRQPWTSVAVSDPALRRAVGDAAEAEQRERHESGRMPPERREALAPLGTGWPEPSRETAPPPAWAAASGRRAAWASAAPRRAGSALALVTACASAGCGRPEPRAGEVASARDVPAARGSASARGVGAARARPAASGVAAGVPRASAPGQPPAASAASAPAASAGDVPPGGLETRTLRYCAVDDVDPHDAERPGRVQTVAAAEAAVDLVAVVDGVVVHEAAWTLPEGLPASPPTRWATAGASLWMLDELDPPLSTPDASDAAWRARLRATPPTVRLRADAEACSVVRGQSPYGATRRTACFDAAGPTRWEEENLSGPRVVALRRRSPGEGCVLTRRAPGAGGAPRPERRGATPER